MNTLLARRRALLDAGARHVGWKVGAGIEEIGPPAFGYLTSATLVAPGGSHDVAGARELRAETELLIEVGGGFGVALELVDVARPPDDAAGIIAANVFHRAAALGSVRVPRPGARARLWVDGAVAAESPVDTDVAVVLSRLREQLAAVDEELRPGDLVLGGSVCHVPVGAGSRVAAEIEGVERVELSLAGP
jgi:2-keto-4-pentenoate hydratase